MTARELRQKYLDFFVKKGHKIIPSASLVPENDPTTLFTSSGMQQLIPYLKGEPHPLGKRLTNFQPSLRGMQQLIPYLKGEPHPLGKRLTNFQPSLRLQDIDEVGDMCHTTFFEMLGNWSLGDYFKEKQLAWCLEFLTKELGLAKDKLYVSVFEGDKSIPKDEESVRIWENLGIAEERIFPYPSDKNWWSRSGTPEQMPVGEIGGPDSEIFYDFGEGFKLHENSPYKNEKCHPNCQCGRFLEIGNSVFIEYEKMADGSLKELSQKNVDFGGGLERLAAATNNNPDIFQIDLFSSIIQIIELLSQKSYQDSQYQKSMRIIADHLKAATFLVADGVEPSNVERGYVLRRLIRRAIRHGRLLGINSQFTPQIAEVVVKNYSDTYPELFKNKEKIKTILSAEEEKFKKTLNQGLKEFERLVLMFRNTRTIVGEKAFYLYESFGFPLELTVELAKEEGFEVDVDGFNQALLKHQELSRKGAEKKFAGGLADHSEEVTKLHTATHLLHQALRIVLGEHVRQSGSNITSERLRFDFSHPQKLTDGEIKKVEDLVNQKIKENLPVKMEILTLEEAKKEGALAFFEEKYGGKVKVYSIGDFSREICGGPHVNFTGSLGRFKIIKEEAAGAGVRRIYATLNFKQDSTKK
ncbi:alanine--tRNA ligase [Candidatus Gottesmanbacteria bacterium]|nr:alanine--tRNA ligase [Candidatus Gottesmanbacteria bacterium]